MSFFFQMSALGRGRSQEGTWRVIWWLSWVLIQCCSTSYTHTCPWVQCMYNKGFDHVTCELWTCNIRKLALYLEWEPYIPPNNPLPCDNCGGGVRSGVAVPGGLWRQLFRSAFWYQSFRASIVRNNPSFLKQSLYSFTQHSKDLLWTPCSVLPFVFTQQCLHHCLPRHRPSPGQWWAPWGSCMLDISPLLLEFSTISHLQNPQLTTSTATQNPSQTKAGTTQAVSPSPTLTVHTQLTTPSPPRSTLQPNQTTKELRPPSNRPHESSSRRSHRPQSLRNRSLPYLPHHHPLYTSKN
jgi:hypothetical protein